MTELLGHNYIGWSTSADGTDVFAAIDPSTGFPLSGSYYPATDEEINSAVTLPATSGTQAVPWERRVAFLQTIGENLQGLGDAWLEMAHKETGLPLERLKTERARTIYQTQVFASLVSEGSWVDARVDHALPDRMPNPKPDFRRMLVPVGPVAVFGASNFPFAYCVAGGDTISAFAAGCPVIVKAHPAHPGTSEMAATAIVEAAKQVGMPEGTFSMVHGTNHEGITLIRHPHLAAAGFTGSLNGGRALMLAAGARANPIPVHAEMGSINPVFLLPQRLEGRTDALATELAHSVTLGIGQYCTNPGLIVAVNSSSLDRLAGQLATRMADVPEGVMLTIGIRASYRDGLKRFESLGATALLPFRQSEGTTAIAGPALYSVDGTTFLANHHLADEVFGPVTLIVACQSHTEMLAVATAIHGQLTATIHGEPKELEANGELIGILSAGVGRLIFNGYPTSVEVTSAMNHSGPYPACSDVRFTSVGPAAIYRFARPMCWQNAPQNLLPLELLDENPRNIRRTVDGVLY